ncbi:MAG: site-2 protease family protein [bacterium]
MDKREKASYGNGRETRVKWSVQVGRFFGIPLKIHITFWLLLLFVALSSGKRGGIQGGAQGVVLVLLLFGCVVLHELGHSVVAQHRGIRVRDIILLPIGGISQMEKIPDEPKSELFIAAIGPLISLTLALGFYILARLLGQNTALPQTSLLDGHVLVSLFWINLILGIFNLLPAFPMDGGRVLRSILAMRIEYLQATHIAVSIGQMFAILFFFYGLFYNFWLALIGIFIYLGAEGEEHETILRRSLRRTPVGQAIITSFNRLSPDDSLQDAMNIACHSLQMDFPVMRDGELIGLLSRDRFVKAMRDLSPDARIGDIMSTDFITIPDTEPLDEAYSQLSEAKASFAPVMHEHTLAGFINLEQIGKYQMICGAGRK